MTTAELEKEMFALVDMFSTVLMATSSTEGDPEISYSPYAIVDGKLHVFVSDLALHTANLKSNPKASLLFIENENNAEKLHARKRVTFSAKADLVDRNSDHFRSVMQAMHSRFGEIIPDFHLFAMSTESAVLVKGFADAHTIECDGFSKS